MAEGLLRALYGDRFEARSAGVEATAVDPRAVSVMREEGIDIYDQRSKSAEELGDIVFDLAVTVCERAKEACPLRRSGRSFRVGGGAASRLQEGSRRDKSVDRREVRMRTGGEDADELRKI